MKPNITLFMILLTAGLFGAFMYWLDCLWDNSMLILSTEKLLGGM